ncbi:MAG: hypothetical protein WCC04_16970 [Terriglobales bacterium]
MSPKTKLANKKHDFEAAFSGLREMMKPYDKKLRVAKDAPAGYMSESKSLRYLGKPLMFAGLTTKSYVSFHLFPVYIFPELANGISPELKKRMQGKTCWNFKKAEQPLFAELGKVVEASFRRFEELGERDLTREDAQALWGKSKGKAKSKKK